jgi:FkbM family methyltransferase
MLIRRMLRRKRPDDVYEYHGVQIPLDDPAIHGRIREVIEGGMYELGDVRAVDAMLTTQDVVLEVGAGLGFMSALCAKRIGDDRVFSYEANPAMEASIRRLHELNGVSPTLTIAAVSDRAGPAALTVEPEFWTGRLEAASTGDVVRTVDIEAECRRHRPSFLLLDCEGSEREILARPVHDSVRKLVVELHPEYLGSRACNDVIRTVLGQGFDVRLDVSGGPLWAFERPED